LRPQGVRTRVAALACAWAAAALASAAPAQVLDRGEVPFELSSDTLQYEPDRRIYVAQGDVVIEQGDRELRADWVSFSNETGRGVATGHVVLVDAGDVLRGSVLEFDVETLEGVIFDARFADDPDGFRMEGSRVVKTGEDTYRVQEGMFTTCRCPAGETDPWQLHTGSADVEIGGYAKGRNNTLEILGVPVLWLPWVAVPVKTERESGLLLPELGFSSRNGVELGQPIFWALHDQVNVTATPRYLSKRGAKGDLEVEYVLGQRSEGVTFGAFLHDFEIDENSAEEPFDAWRWGVTGRHDLFLPGGVRFKTRYAVPSDNQYPIDFDELRDHRFDRYIESSGFVTHEAEGTGRIGGLAGIYYADDLQNPDDLDRDDFVLHRLPHAEARLLPAGAPGPEWLSRLVPALDVEYTHFRSFDDPQSELGVGAVGDSLFVDVGVDGIPNARERNPNTGRPLVGGSGDGSTDMDGRFQEGEPLADDGHRIVLRPRLGAPFRVGDLAEVYPELGWHQTLYSTDAQSFESRGILTGRVDLRTRLRRQYGNGVVHLLEPRVGWASVEVMGQGGDPLFVPGTALPQRRIRELSLENRTLDPADRIDDFHGVVVGVGNRIYAPPGPGRPARLLADFVLSGEWDFADSDPGLLLVDGRAWPHEQLVTRFHLGFDPEDADFEEVLASLAWDFEGGHSLHFDYRYRDDIPLFFEDFQFLDRLDEFEDGFDRVNQIGGGFYLVLGDHWRAYYSISVSLEELFILGNRGGIEYISECRCWAAGIAVSQDRNGGLRLGLTYRVTGLGGEGRPERLGLGFP